MKEIYWMKAGKTYSILFLAVLLLFTGCTSGETVTSDHPPLKVGWSLFPGWYPMAIAVEQDLFGKHGVAVEPVFYDLYAETFADIQTGKLDGALVTLGDALLMDGRVPESIRVVLVTDNSAGADAIVATTDIETMDDLRGKHIGTNLGSFGELLVRNMLAANGLTVKDVTLVDIDPETVPDKMPDVIQAGHVWEPFISRAVAQGYHIIFSSAETPGLIPDLLVVRTEVTEVRPDDVRAFIAAWLEAVEWWQAHPAEGNALIAQVTGLNPEEISVEGVRLFNLEDNLRTFAKRPGTDISSLYGSGQVNIDFLLNTGSLNNAPDMELLLDESFLK